MTQGREQFDRVASLVVAPIDGGVGFEIKGLRIAFNIEKKSSSAANKAEISVFNLSADHRNAIKAKKQAVILKAGYGDALMLIASGIIQRVEHTPQPPDVETKLQIRDGGLGLDHAEFRKAYRAGTPRRRIVEDIIGAMPDVALGPLLASGINGTTTSKVAFSGSARRALDKLGRAWRFEWSVQNGAAQVLDRTGTSRPKYEAIVLSKTTGLIGSPTLTNAGCKVQCLLRPELVPGCYLDVRSSFLSGYFKAVSASHKGDTHGADWTTEAEAKKL